MKNLASLVSTFALGLGSLACTNVESHGVPTDELIAHIVVEADAEGRSSAYANLWRPREGVLIPDSVNLVAEDRFIATLGAESKIMAETMVIGLYGYSASFDSAPVGELFRVELARMDEASAPDSTVTLPEPFDLGPVPASHSRAEDLVVTWSPAGSSDTMIVKVSGNCVQTYEQQAATDGGSHTIAAGSIMLSEATECQGKPLEGISVEVRRRRVGTLDPAYGEGWIHGQQVRGATFTLDL